MDKLKVTDVVVGKLVTDDGYIPRSPITTADEYRAKEAEQRRNEVIQRRKEIVKQLAAKKIADYYREAGPIITTADEYRGKEAEQRLLQEADAEVGQIEGGE
jgi:hypothetical protein